MDTPGVNVTQQRCFCNALELHCNLTKSNGAETSLFDSRRGQRTFLEKSRPVLGPAHNPIERVPRALSLSGSKVKPTTRLNLQQRLRMSGDKPTLPYTPSRDAQRHLHLPTFYRDTNVFTAADFSIQIKFYENSKIHFTYFMFYTACNVI